MKRSELFFGAVLVPLDYLALLAAGAAAYFIRVSPAVQEIRPAVFEVDLTLAEHMQLVSVVALAIIVIFALQGLYSLSVTRRVLDEFTKIFSGVSLGVMLVLVVIFLSAELFQSRFIIIAAYGLGIAFVALGRYFVKRVQQMLLRRGYGIHRVVLAGNGKFAEEIKDIIAARPHLGYRVVGEVEDIDWDELERIHRERGMDEIIQTHPTLSEKDNLRLLDFAEQYKVDYKYVPNTFETHAVNVQYRQVGSVPLLELQRTTLDGWGRIAKRIVDIIGSSIGLILLTPLFAWAAIAIKLDSKGPVFYRQVRVGRNMQPFEIIKFRSMFLQDCVGSRYGGKQAQQRDKQLRQQTNERSGPLFKMRDDPRITKVGRFLRKWRIDELPQLINVFKGEMSLFGPRPHLPEEVSNYTKHQQRLFTIKPGMSGMAQVEGNAGLSFSEEAKLDIAYIENWSLWLDIVLLVKTLRLLFFDRNAV